MSRLAFRTRLLLGFILVIGIVAFVSTWTGFSFISRTVMKEAMLRVEMDLGAAWSAYEAERTRVQVVVSMVSQSELLRAALRRASSRAPGSRTSWTRSGGGHDVDFLTLVGGTGADRAVPAAVRGRGQGGARARSSVRPRGTGDQRNGPHVAGRAAPRGREARREGQHPARLHGACDPHGQGRRGQGDGPRGGDPGARLARARAGGRLRGRAAQPEVRPRRPHPRHRVRRPDLRGQAGGHGDALPRGRAHRHQRDARRRNARPGDAGLARRSTTRSSVAASASPTGRSS